MNNLPIDPDGDEMGILGDQWLHARRIAVASPRQTMLQVKSVAAAANCLPGQKDTWRKSLQFS